MFKIRPLLASPCSAPKCVFSRMILEISVMPMNEAISPYKVLWKPQFAAAVDKWAATESMVRAVIATLLGILEARERGVSRAAQILSGKTCCPRIKLQSSSGFRERPSGEVPATRGSWPQRRKTRTPFSEMAGEV